MTSPREHILTAATHCFAEAGYNGTSVRKIARAADVSLSMIGYYFGGKDGLLTAVFERFFRSIREVIDHSFVKGRPFELAFRAYVRGVVELYRSDPHLVRVALTELPLEPDRMAHSRAKHLEEVMPRMQAILTPVLERRGGVGPVPFDVLGPGAAMFIASHFLLRPILERRRGHAFDDAFYDAYPEWVADVLMHGICGSRWESGFDRGSSPEKHS